VNALAKEGLRTMVMCTKELTRFEFEKWFREYEEAESTIENRKEKIEEVLMKLELELELVGCTGVEDQLQEGCVETIEFFVMVCFTHHHLLPFILFLFFFFIFFYFILK
jgi:magnesium-transporting ATPase (P-type)